MIIDRCNVGDTTFLVWKRIGVIAGTRQTRMELYCKVLGGSAVSLYKGHYHLNDPAALTSLYEMIRMNS